MHDRLDLVPAHLLGPAPLVQRGDRTLRVRIGLVGEDGGEVPVESIELRGDLRCGGGLPGSDPLRTLLPQVADEQSQQLFGLACRHLITVGDGARGGGFHAARLEILEQAGDGVARTGARRRSEEHTSELQSLAYLVCRLLLEKKKKKKQR